MTQTEQKVDLDEVDQAHLSRYYVEHGCARYVHDRFSSEIGLVEAEISEEQKKLEYLKNRLSNMIEEKSGVEVRIQQIEQIMSGVKRRVLEKAEIEPDPDAYTLQTSPNGTVLALIPKEGD